MAVDSAPALETGSRVTSARQVLQAGLAVLCFVFVLRCAWVCDDAYITMRSADNLVHGRGVAWNPGERVQAYTNPLWMLLLAAFHAVLRDGYATLLMTSLLATALFLFLFVKWHARGRSAGTLALIALASSKSFVDYSTSGLENPLTHVLLVWAYRVFWDGARDLRGLCTLAFISSLGAWNRLDSFLLFVPALVASGWGVLRKEGTRRAALAVFLGSIPLFGWEAFSLFYYGELVPNTAHAKLGTGIGIADYLFRGWRYLICTSAADPSALLLILLALALAWKGRRSGMPGSWPAAAAILLGFAYTFRIGGDFMLGRLYTPLLVLACCILSRSTLSTGLLRAGFAVVVAIGILHPLSPWRSGPDYDFFKVNELGMFRPYGGVQDDRGAYFPGTGLFRKPRTFRNDHPWVQQGLLARERAERGSSKPVVAASMGMSGFYAGPGVVVFDLFGLADPLLARLPMKEHQRWRPGHITRRVPVGYYATRETGENQIEDADLAAYYDELSFVLRGELWSWRRVLAIWRIHFGEARARFELYRRRYREGRAACDPLPGRD